jgi:hypothetical protein
MQQLLLIAAQHAGCADLFSELVPCWSLASLFDRIVGTKCSGGLIQLRKLTCREPVMHYTSGSASAGYHDLTKGLMIVATSARNTGPRTHRFGTT